MVLWIDRIGKKQKKHMPSDNEIYHYQRDGESVKLEFAIKALSMESLKSLLKEFIESKYYIGAFVVQKEIRSRVK